MSNEQLLEIEVNSLVKYASNHILITDGAGIILRASPSNKEIYGVEIEELLGQSVLKFEKQGIFSPSVSKKVMEEKKQIQVIQQTKTGRTVMATGIPIYDEQQKIVRIISFSIDLTEIEQLKAEYEKLLSKVKLYETEIEYLRDNQFALQHIISQSDLMKKAIKMTEQVAKTEANLVFLGESGVGKTMFAQLVHKISERAQQAFIEVNCSAIPESLFESEIFGYESGAFTGASKSGKLGFIELAQNGTLFLDEIGELPLSMQAKLLKVIQEKKIMRIGGTKPIAVDFRLIAATNQNLEEMVKQKTFRADLYYRLNVMMITIPPLRERKEDIAPLAQLYLNMQNDKYKTAKQFHPHAIKEMLAYDWPGNTRELQNIIERLVITTEESIITAEQLRLHLPAVQLNFSDFKRLHESEYTLKEALELVEKNYLMNAQKKANSTYEMAEILGINQSTVVRKMKKYRINAK